MIGLRLRMFVLRGGTCPGKKNGMSCLPRSEARKMLDWCSGRTVFGDVKIEVLMHTAFLHFLRGFVIIAECIAVGLQVIMMNMHFSGLLHARMIAIHIMYS